MYQCRWANELVQAQVLYFWLLNGLDESHISKIIWVIKSMLYILCKLVCEAVAGNVYVCMHVREVLLMAMACMSRFLHQECR